jgi:hypothetical protein
MPQALLPENMVPTPNGLFYLKATEPYPHVWSCHIGYQQTCCTSTDEHHLVSQIAKLLNDQP